MPFLLILLFPVLEIYVLIKVGSSLGLLNTVLVLLGSALLGVSLARMQGVLIFRNMQMSMAKGEVPSAQVLHGLLVFVGGLLFLMPGFVSDFIALFFVLPGLRHLTVLYFRKKLQSQVGRGGFRVFTAGFGTGPFGGFQPPPGPSGPAGDIWERDVSPKVIDVTPISSQTETEKNPRDENS